MSSLKGKTAPSFTLADTEKNKVSLSDFSGKNVVLMFFPAAFSGVCTKEMCSVRDDLSEYQDMNAVTLGISVDSFFSLAKFKEFNNINFSLLSDFNKETCKAYGTLYEEWILGMKGVSKRSVFVIDKSGVVRHEEILEVAGDLPNLDEVKKVLASMN